MTQVNCVTGLNNHFPLSTYQIQPNQIRSRKLQICNELSSPKTVKQLSQVFGITVSAIHKHLKKLVETGSVKKSQQLIDTRVIIYWRSNQ